MLSAVGFLVAEGLQERTATVLCPLY